MADPVITQVEDFPVLQGPRRPVGQVIQGDHHANPAVCDLALRGYGQPLVHRTTFVSLDVPEGDPAELRNRHDLGDGLGYQRKHGPGARVEQQGLLGFYQELVEGEAIGGYLGHEGGKPENPISNFMGLRIHH
jgi:hypothetical protein